MKKLILGVLPEPLVQDRVYTTCRNGDAWFVNTSVGDEITIVDGDGNLLGEGVVVFQDIGAFESIPQLWLDMNYDPNARTSDGLYAAMRAAYPDGWTEDEVTSLGFMIRG